MNILFEMFKKNFGKILSGEYKTKHNGIGKTYYKKDLEEMKDISNIIKAFAFKGKDPCYYINNNGKKICLSWWEEE